MQLLFIVELSLLAKILLSLFVALFVGGAIIIGNWDKIIGKSICVLGLSQTGKTLFYKALQSQYSSEKDYVYDETGIERIAGFKLKDSSGNTILKIRESSDISGRDNVATIYYPELVKKSDVVIYCCNIHEYLTDEEQARAVRARLSMIYTLLKNNGKIVEDPVKNESHVRMILTYADQVDNRKDAIEKFVKTLNKEKNLIYFGGKIAAVNMTDKDEVETLIHDLFYGK